MKILIGDKYSKKINITEEMVNGFAKYSGDKNPLHLDNEFAKNSIFKKRIAHGFLIGSQISAIIGNEFPGNGSIYLSQTMKFLGPVYLNDQITTQVEVIGFPKDKWITLKTNCYNQDEMMVIEGEAMVIPPFGTKLII